MMTLSIAPDRLYATAVSTSDWMWAGEDSPSQLSLAASRVPSFSSVGKNAPDDSTSVSRAWSARTIAVLMDQERSASFSCAQHAQAKRRPTTSPVATANWHSTLTRETSSETLSRNRATIRTATAHRLSLTPREIAYQVGAVAQFTYRRFATASTPSAPP